MFFDNLYINYEIDKVLFSEFSFSKKLLVSRKKTDESQYSKT